MSAVHTPGPWIADEHHGVWGVFAESDGDGICYLIEEGAMHSRILQPEHAAANAHLIATAPELLSLLEDALISFAGSVEGGEADEWVKFSRAAVAKAKGGAA